MSRRLPSWLQLLAVAFLALQGILPVLPVLARPIALAQETPPIISASPGADDAGIQIAQPEQTLASEPPPAAPIPPSEPRLPVGQYALRLAADGRAARFADLPITLTREPGAAAAWVDARLDVLAPDTAAQISPVGVAFTLAVSRTVATARSAQGAPVYLTLDYGRMDLPTYGGSFTQNG